MWKYICRQTQLSSLCHVTSLVPLLLKLNFYLELLNVEKSGSVFSCFNVEHKLITTNPTKTKFYYITYVLLRNKDDNCLVQCFSTWVR
jgi:hypothetical protein